MYGGVGGRRAKAFLLPDFNTLVLEYFTASGIIKRERFSKVSFFKIVGTSFSGTE
jgi:hypothetical protein